jgi:hypothetical protein
VQPPKLKKALTIKKIVEPISKRKLAWEMTEEEEEEDEEEEEEEEGKMTISNQHVHEFFKLMSKTARK